DPFQGGDDLRIERAGRCPDETQRVTGNGGGVAFERLINADIEVVAGDIPGRSKRCQVSDERREIEWTPVVRMGNAAACEEGGAGIGNTAAQEQPVLSEATVVLRQLVQECGRFAARHHMPMTQRNELGCTRRAGSGENKSDVVGPGGRRNGRRAILRARKVERDAPRGVRIPSMTDLDHAHSPCARNVAHGRVEPRIDDDGFDATGIEVASELVRLIFVTDRDMYRAPRATENRRQRFRAPAMNDREATVTTETCMLELG